MQICAVKSFVAATQANAADSRALGLLKQLLTDHPELEYDFQNELAACQKAVEAVNAEMRFAEWTRGGVLRHAEFGGIREDKEVHEVHG